MYSHCNVGLQGHEYLVKLLLLLTAVWQALADDLLGKLATNDSLQHGRQLPISQVLVCCVLCQAFIWLGFGAGCASAALVLSNAVLATTVKYSLQGRCMT